MNETTQGHDVILDRKLLKKLLRLDKDGYEVGVRIIETLSNDEYEARLHTTVDVGAL